MKAIVKIGLKPGVLDPQGRTIARSLDHMGFEGVTNARQGKIIELDLKSKDKAEALKQVEEMSRKLLANTVIEDYEIEIIEQN
ncbi:MAG TPA: phosphoribosylformylglycinamidine synthase subunit PurS [Hellea balneolensis]|uniref:Phosphoribosylformylglycinamidine synthase subunit PurS n=1 Tax=Hellea balneolensis TaxID=287478 RepID=A0A7V5U0W6_9PROT|nr:phosphoribosylformylglycinamidine synthase subunit PurS [Hellea balneolensis]